MLLLLLLLLHMVADALKGGSLELRVLTHASMHACMCAHARTHAPWRLPGRQAASPKPQGPAPGPGSPARWLTAAHAGQQRHWVNHLQARAHLRAFARAPRERAVCVLCIHTGDHLLLPAPPAAWPTSSFISDAAHQLLQRPLPLQLLCAAKLLEYALQVVVMGAWLGWDGHVACFNPILFKVECWQAKQEQQLHQL